MSGFSLNSILNGASQLPAGERMEVALIAHGNIKPNPENQKIYVVGDVAALKADILANGLRQPLEVIPAGGDEYMLLGGERRWTAIGQLLQEDEANRARFGRVPCIIRQSRGADGDLLALITANMTARELTDGERLAQYEALKRVFENKKAGGELTGRVRDAMAETLGIGGGTLGRLNAVAEHCSDEVKDMLRAGKTTLARAYEASKLWKRQQMGFLQRGYVPALPDMTREQQKAVYDWVAAEAPLEGVDWMADNYYESGISKALNELKATAELPFGKVRIRDGCAYLVDPEDPDDAQSQVGLYYWQLLEPARERRLTPEQKADLERRRAERAAPAAKEPERDGTDADGKGADAAPGGADAPDVSDVSSVDTREERIEDIADALKYGELPGLWEKLGRYDLLHMDSYQLPLRDGQFLYMLNSDNSDDYELRMYLRVDGQNGILPLAYPDRVADEDNPNWWASAFYDESDDAIDAVLHEAAALLLDSDPDDGEGGAP